MKIGIIGAGAIGGWVAARLALAGHDIAVLARGSTLEALQGGLSITEAGTTQPTDVRASDQAVELGVQDILVIAVKAPALADAAEAAKTDRADAQRRALVVLGRPAAGVGRPWQTDRGRPATVAVGRLRRPRRLPPHRTECD
ncbi:MAG TPA: 2-dehydropantoate 2-reductase N-terminal domain-containing protein [Sphingomicrobium sp.]